MSKDGPSFFARVIEWLAADRMRRYWVLVLFVAALIVRLLWNLKIHPLGSFLYSDMKGYWGRADLILDKPFTNREYDAFFPFGTAWLMVGIKLLFGRDNLVAVSVIYAVFGASIVAACYAIADRVIGERQRWVAPAVGLFLVLYYPLIAVGGYILSELPFSFCLTMALLLLIRVVDEGRRLDAWLLGLALGCGALIRPQMLLSVALVGGFWLAFWLIARLRPDKPSPYAKLDWGHIARIAVPLVLLLALASIRFYVHTHRVGLISDNSSINLVFGRCHNKGIYSRRDGQGHGTIRFSPPPLIQLEAYSARDPANWPQIRSVWAEHPEHVEGVPGFAVDSFGCLRRKCHLPGSEIEYRGYIGDHEVHRKLVRACIERGGLGRQAYFTWSHWVMLWRANLMWPDQANPRPRSTERSEGWRQRQQIWARIHRGLLMVPALLGLIFVLVPRRRPKQALVSLNLWALMLIAGIWLGGVRFRIPYDPVITLVAGFVYAEGWMWLRGWIRRRREGRA